jgi:Kdo2-lipid IVA lauroyltransferase/acyltransferase
MARAKAAGWVAWGWPPAQYSCRSGSYNTFVAMTDWLASLRNAPLHALAWLTMLLSRLLPERAALRFGQTLALATWWVFPRWRRTSLRNLELFYQNSPADEQPSRAAKLFIARQAAINLGYHVIEFIRMGQLPVEQALAMVVEEEGIEHYTEAFKLGRGVIGLAMHYGNWEMCAAYCTHRMQPIAVNVVGKEQRDDFFTRIAFPWRAKYGIRNIYAGDKVNSAILRALKDNEMLGLAADQNGGQHGVFAPFCGISASTVKGPAALALKTGAPLVLSICKRLSPGRFRFIVMPPLDMSGLPQDRELAIVEVLARMNACYEAVLREDPTQWLWGHKRWKTRPPGGPLLY